MPNDLDQIATAATENIKIAGMGIAPSDCWACSAWPPMPRRMSVWPTASQIRTPEGAGIKGGALVLPLCNTAAMNLHLAEISIMVSPGKHAVLLLDQAGWHLSADVVVPDNITLLPLPAKCPELNVMENVWQFMRDNWLSNRVFRDHDDIVAHCCHNGSRLIDQPWHIMSIGCANGRMGSDQWELV